MKKIMILGGGVNQLGLIRTAKSCGYLVVLCDNNPECVARKEVNQFYQVNIIDADGLTEIGKAERIHGVISNSEIAMETVAVVAERLGLVGNPPNSISILQSKHDFRVIQNKLGIFSPRNKILTAEDNIEEALNEFAFPVIVKPVKCSGTRGTAKFYIKDLAAIEAAVKECVHFSRDKQCIIEEYIEMPSLAMVEGEVFVNNDMFFWGGLYHTFRSKKLPMVPMTYVSPYIDTQEHLFNIKNELSRIFTGLGIRHGEYNVEAYFEQQDVFFVIEINARQGGHGLPAFVKLATEVDMDRMLVTTAVGDQDYFDLVLNSFLRQKYAVRHTVFGDLNGKYQGLFISEEIQPYVVQVEEEKQIGEYVEKRINGSSVIGFVNLVFEDYETQRFYSERIEDFIYPLIRE